MLFLMIAALLRGSLAELPADFWTCSNQLEVWCAADGCAAVPPGEFTPMDVSADQSGFTVCAYTGCWRGEGAPLRGKGRALWTGDALVFSTAPDGAMTADATLLIIEKEGVGFARVGGLATPLLCQRMQPPR